MSAHVWQMYVCTLSKWLKAPLIHVLSAYAANVAVLPSTSGSPVDGGCCSRCHISGEDWQHRHGQDAT